MGYKEGAGRANLRKKEKTIGLVGSKTGGGEGQPKEKRENKWISMGYKQRAGRAKPKEKRENKWISRV